MKKIVVGIDGSETGRAALEWALGEAASRGAELEVVHAWISEFYVIPVTGMPAVAEQPGDTEQLAKDLLDVELDKFQQFSADVKITKKTIEGPPARVLLECSKDADLLVVGSRGRGGFTGLLLGSVSQQLSHHAKCPLVIVPVAH